MMKYHPWFEPLSRRIGTTVLCALWLGFEAWHQPEGIWLWLAMACTGYAVWDFFLSGRYGARAEPE